MLNLNTENEAARYLMRRGLEVMQATLTSRRVQERMAENITAEAMIKAMLGQGFEPDMEQIKQLKKGSEK